MEQYLDSYSQRSVFYLGEKIKQVIEVLEIKQVAENEGEFIPINSKIKKNGIKLKIKTNVKIPTRYKFLYTLKVSTDLLCGDPFRASEEEILGWLKITDKIGKEANQLF